MEKDLLLHAFAKIKLEISELKQAINTISDELIDQRIQIKSINNEIKRTVDRQTDRHPSQTHNSQIQTQNSPQIASKPQNRVFSNGNEGVQTDRQTFRQTDRHPPISDGKTIQKTPILHKNTPYNPDFTHKPKKGSKIDHLEKVSQIINSLDDIKRDLRQKFKKLTPKEMQVFQTIYSLEEKGIIVDYSLLSEHLNISQSAIRDYLKNIIQKGIPIDKIKENNKKITLKIAPNLKKITSLETIITLREL